MTSRIQTNRLLLACLLALGVITIAIVWIFATDEDASKKPAPSRAEPGRIQVQLEAWPTDGAQKISVTVDPERGPIWEHGDDSIVLTPKSDDASFDIWTVETRDDRTVVVGTGTLGQAGLSATWTFVEGNPQAHLAIDLHGMTADRLASPVEFTWPRFTGPPPLTDKPTGPPHQHLVLWWPPADLTCDANMDDPSFDLHTRHIVTLPKPTGVWRWHYADGASAQLVPVFDLPGTHPDPQIAQTAAKGASAWLHRVRTLIYGHSNPDDPRYGNGGLLGHGLGATIAVPSKWVETPDVVELSEDLRGSRVELAPRDTTEDTYLHSTHFSMPPSCSTLVELSQKGSPAAIVGLVASQDATPKQTDTSKNAPTRGFLGGTTSLVATTAPVQLDGQLSSLLEHGFDIQALDPLVRARGSFVFSAPFVATRNPLIGAAKEGLLKPERDGHWTLSQDLSEALANLELWREATPLVVTSVGKAASQASASKDVLQWWTPDGALHVYNPTSKTVPGYTLVVSGVVEASRENGSLSSRQILLDAQRQATLLWWDLKPGVHTVRLSAQDSGLATPTPVDWQITAP
jgi:hypothetical protein